jgi:mRNA-degrading endonuclease RelE of RelBE toxin-antitoxin system
MKVVFSPSFQRQVLAMDRADTRLIGAALSRLQVTEIPIGKRLSGALHNCYSIRVGLNHRMRLVYEVKQLDARVLVVGPRERGIVYIQAIQVLKELER